MVKFCIKIYEVCIHIKVLQWKEMYTTGRFSIFMWRPTATYWWFKYFLNYKYVSSVHLKILLYFVGYLKPLHQLQNFFIVKLEFWMQHKKEQQRHDQALFQSIIWANSGKRKGLRNSAEVMSQNSLCPDRNSNLVFN